MYRGAIGRWRGGGLSAGCGLPGGENRLMSQKRKSTAAAAAPAGHVRAIEPLERRVMLSGAQLVKDINPTTLGLTASVWKVDFNGSDVVALTSKGAYRTDG